MSAPASAVLVRKQPWGESSFALCHADVFEHDTLTVTVSETGATIETYAPGTWIDATVSDERGNVLYFLQSRLGQQQDQQVAARRLQKVS